MKVEPHTEKNFLSHEPSTLVESKESGRQLNGELLAAKALVKAQREGVRERAARVNELKRLIDDLQVRSESIVKHWACL